VAPPVKNHRILVFSKVGLPNCLCWQQLAYRLGRRCWSSILCYPYLLCTMQPPYHQVSYLVNKNIATVTMWCGKLTPKQKCLQQSLKLTVVNWPVARTMTKHPTHEDQHTKASISKAAVYVELRIACQMQIRAEGQHCWIQVWYHQLDMQLPGQMTGLHLHPIKMPTRWSSNIAPGMRLCTKTNFQMETTVCIWNVANK